MTVHTTAHILARMLSSACLYSYVHAGRSVTDAYEQPHMNMQGAGDGDAVQGVLSALAPKIEASTAELDALAISYSLFGLQV